MIEATIDQFTMDPQSFLRQSQGERVLVTEGGKPIAVLVGVANKDEEDFQLQSSPEFWRMIEARRRAGAGRPLEEVEAMLFGDDTGPK